MSTTKIIVIFLVLITAGAGLIFLGNKLAESNS